MGPLLPLVKPSRRTVLSAATAGVVAPRAALAQERAAVPQRRTVEDALRQLQRLAEDARQRTGIPGLAIAVVYKDEVIYLEGFGLREAGKTAAVDPDTVFQLASVSKPIATTVVAALVGQRIVGWDDPIVRHDPGFQMYDPWVTRQITLRDMFVHRSGLPDHAGDALEDIGYGRAEILYRLRYQKPDSSFRSHYAYTNFGFTEAAVAAAMASGNSWEEASAELVYRPLGMRHTSSRFAEFSASANRALSHVRLDGKWVAKYTRNPDPQSPAGGVCSTARDMALWLRLQLGGGKLGGKEIVAAAPFAETHRPQIVRMPPKDPAVDHVGFYGLGWNIGYDAEGRVRWSHSGGFALGAATSVSVLPAQELGIIVLTNAQPIGVPEALSRSFFDVVLTGKVEQDWLPLYAQSMAATPPSEYGTAIDYSKPPVPPSSALPAAAYAGTYQNDLYGPIAIAATDAGLAVELGPGRQPFAMQHFDRDVFTYQPSGENAAGVSAITFTIAADRQANTVTIENLDVYGQGTFARVAAGR